MEKNIIVTGGSRGIGACIVENLAKQGHNVLLNYNKSEESAKRLADRINNEGGNVEIYKADVSNIEESEKMIKYAIQKFKKIDVLINNAGVSHFKLFNDITIGDWNNIIDTNLKSAFFITQNVVKNMINNKERMYY